MGSNEKVRAGSKQNQIGRAVSNFAHKSGYNVIQNLTGHGIGLSLHEAPNHILSYYDPMDNALLKDGLVIAVEPFISMKADHIIERGDDGWTFVAPDKSLVAQCEHTVVVTRRTNNFNRNLIPKRLFCRFIPHKTAVFIFGKICELLLNSLSFKYIIFSGGYLSLSLLKRYCN